MKKALFLDRDGIINVDHGYVYKIEEFEFMPDIFDLCKLAVEKDYLIVVITNQSGIARGKYTEQNFDILTQWMCEQFTRNNIKITDVFYCPHHPTKGHGKYLKVCDCRKPQPGLIHKAIAKYNIDVEQSIFIGDKLSDMEAAIAAKVKNRILFTKENINHSLPDVTEISQLAKISTIFV